jgi:Phage tail tube protein, GTA-gp10
MTNVHRGDVSFVLDGVVHALRLTLGSLASLENSLGSHGLQDLGKRLERGYFSSSDVCEILAAGFCGGGASITASEIGSRVPASDLIKATQAATELLDRAFGDGAQSHPLPPQAM